MFLAFFQREELWGSLTDWLGQWEDRQWEAWCNELGSVSWRQWGKQSFLPRRLRHQSAARLIGSGQVRVSTLWQPVWQSRKTVNMCTADSIQVRAGCCECVENAAASVSEPEKRFVVHSCLVFTKIIMFKYESTLTVVPSCFCRVSLDLCRSGVFGDHRYANESSSLKI